MVIPLRAFVGADAMLFKNFQELSVRSAGLLRKWCHLSQVGFSRMRALGVRMTSVLTELLEINISAIG